MQAIRSIQLWGTLVALCLAPLFFGSVDRIWMSGWLIVLSISTICGVVAQPNCGQRNILLVFVVVCCAYAVVAIAQIVPGLSNRLNDPIWRSAAGALRNELLPRISSRAEIPPVAIGHFLLVVTSFASGFSVGLSRRWGALLITTARYAILVYAIYGIAALVFTPTMLLWVPKLAYQGSLTASFINHNTAATFIGGGTILWFCKALQTGQSIRFSSLRILLLTPSYERVAFRLILQLVAGLVCFFALLLTRSRGGLICSSLGMLVAIGLIVMKTMKPKFWRLLAAGGVALIVLFVWLSQMGRIGSQGLLDDGRWFVYQYCIEAIRHRPLLGAGAGTFAELFPSMRGAALNTGGIWEQAHSTVLEIFVEMGIPIGTAVLLGAIAAVLFLGRGALKGADHDQNSLAAVAGIAALGFAHSTIDFSLQIPGYFIVFWIVLGCGLARASADGVTGAKARSRRPVVV
ncbi:MAG: O-antigen ligase family protein [Rhizobiales bacterium]|nr:O-antigen ligase family protein [Hyphomicrobiales bacterium]